MTRGSKQCLNATWVLRIHRVKLDRTLSMILWHHCVDIGNVVCCAWPIRSCDEPMGFSVCLARSEVPILSPAAPAALRALKPPAESSAIGRTHFGVGSNPGISMHLSFASKSYYRFFLSSYCFVTREKTHLWKWCAFRSFNGKLGISGSCRKELTPTWTEQTRQPGMGHARCAESLPKSYQGNDIEGKRLRMESWEKKMGHGLT